MCRGRGFESRRSDHFSSFTEAGDTAGGFRASVKIQGFCKEKAGGDPAFEFVLLREGRIRFHEIHPTVPIVHKRVPLRCDGDHRTDFFKKFLAPAKTDNSGIILFNIKMLFELLKVRHSQAPARKEYFRQETAFFAAVTSSAI